MGHDSNASRRDILRILAGGAVLAAGARPAFAGLSRIDRLIVESKAFPTISQRIGFISNALLGLPYLKHTLIGGPNLPEQMVLRDDGFDCVTYCETVLAAAMVREPSEFAETLRKIRYHDGIVDWRGRNHYFSEWSDNNVANHICQRVTLPGSLAVPRTVNYMPELGERHVTLAAIPCPDLLANTKLAATGDIVGFVSERAKLDYFHIGFVVIRDGKMFVRHAAQSKHRVLDERMDSFLAFNRVHRVTLLRPEEPAPVAVASHAN
jgi:hypothetical protein